jgi:hypothetical protein
VQMVLRRANSHSNFHKTETEGRFRCGRGFPLYYGYLEKNKRLSLRLKKLLELEHYIVRVEHELEMREGRLTWGTVCVVCFVRQLRNPNFTPGIMVVY